MKITKYGHACLLVDEEGVRILIDPGIYSKHMRAEHLDAILITHNHQDHMDKELITELLVQNPLMQIITVAEAGKNLDEAGIPYTTIEDGEETTVSGVSVRSFGKHHSYIYGEMPQCQNTGFMIANRFYHPGDSLHQPEMPVEILALPVAGPWMKISEAIDYAKAVKPDIAIPMHDAFLVPSGMQMMRGFVKNTLAPEGIAFRDMQDGATETF